MQLEYSIASRIGSAALAGAMFGAAAPALAQATSRPCVPGADERPGPACLLAHRSLGTLPAPAVYWRVRAYPDLAAALRAQPPQGIVAVAFGQAWMFTIGPKGQGGEDGEQVAEVGPIPIDAGVAYDAELLKSTFSPGMRAPIHVHSGPEAFYAVSGDTYLETPDGVQYARGPGNSLVVRRGPPMLLMAPGPEPRKGFALVLHDRSLAPTTLVADWTPKGLCVEAAGTDR